MFKIQTLNKISSTGLNVLPKDKYEISDNPDLPDGIILRSFNMHETEIPNSVLAVARAGAGVNNIPIDKCTEKGIVVFNTPGANANGVKELVIAALIMTSRNVVGGIKWVSTLESKDDVAKLVEKGKGDFAGPEIMGKTIGVVGLGAIGMLVANAAAALGMNVCGYDPFLSEEAAKNLCSNVKVTESLTELYASSDYISLHLPVNKDTKGMINESVLNSVKDGVRILNFARGELVDNNAVKAAIESGKISFYITDFPDGTLVNQRNIITIPHLGASTPESEENCAFMAANQLKNYLETGNIKNSVNFPALNLDYPGGSRVCVISSACVSDAVSELLKSKGVTVNGMLAKSRGSVFYSVFDTDKCSCEVCKEIQTLENIVSVRVI